MSAPVPAVPATGIELLDAVLGLLAAYAYLVTFAATILENVFIVGSFTPGETIVLAAAFVTAPPGGAHPLGVWVMSVLGTMIGSNISYLLGRRGGRPMLERYGHRFKMGETRILAAEHYFEEHGSKTVLISRFAAGIKNFVPMIAGMSRMHLWLFELYVLIGGIIYTTVMVVLGVWFGENFSRALRYATRLGYAGFALFVAAIALVLWWRRRYTKRRLIEEAEEATAEDRALAEGRPLPEPGPHGDDEGGERP